MEHERRPPMTALERARQVSEALSEAARRARFSARTRRNLSGGGFQARRGAAAMRWFVLTTFWLIVGLPSIATVAYYGFIASDQYVSEMRFTVAGGEAPSIDGIGVLAGLPSVTVIQDTQIVTNFLESRAAVEQLQEKLDLRRRFSLPGVDFLSRFDPEKPIEKLVRYWGRQISVSTKLPSGIVQFKVRAFTPEDALAIARETNQISEDLINQLNARMNRDAVRSGEAELDRASSRLSVARIALQKARDEAGILDVKSSMEGLDKLILETRSAVLKMKQEYATQLRAVSETAPQMRNLKSRIDATEAQILEMEARLTSFRSPGAGQQTLANSMTRFAMLDLERQIAERLYAGAVATLELARLTAERKQMYLNTFVAPTLPQEAQYPRRMLTIFVICISALALWGMIVGLASVVRNHMA